MKKRTLAFFLALALLLAQLPLLSAAAEDAVDLVWLTNYDRGAKPLKEGGDRIIDALNERLNINLISKGVAAEHINGWSKINMMIASGEIPDVLTCGYPSATTSRWIEEGILIPLNDYLDKMPTVKALLESRYQWTAIDGKYYGYPFIEQVTNTHFYYRQDILDQLGLTYTGTLDNFYEICKTVKEKMDGIYPISTQNFKWVYAAYGLEYSDYALDAAGNPIPVFETAAYKQGLEFLRKMWDEELIDPEFMLQDTKKREEMFATGKTVFMIGSLFRYLNQMETSLHAVNPDGVLTFADPPAGPDGKKALGTVPKSGILTGITADCKNPEKAAELIEFMVSSEGKDLFRLGIEGVHYTRNGDTVIYNEAEREADNFTKNGWGHPLAFGAFFWPLTDMYLPQTEPNYERAVQSVVVANQNVLPNLVPFTLDAELEYSGVLDELVNQYFIDILMGKIGIDEGLAQLSEKWRAQGGNKVLAAVGEAIGAN